jgi:hypothetical protein
MENSAEDPGRETRIVPIKDVNIVVRKPTDAQLLLLSRDGRRGMRDDISNMDRMTAAARVFDIFESLVVTEEDRQKLLDLIVAGELHLSDLSGFISAFNEEEPKAKVRRGGRPPAKRA